MKFNRQNLMISTYSNTSVQAILISKLMIIFTNSCSQISNMYMYLT